MSEVKHAPFDWEKDYVELMDDAWSEWASGNGPEERRAALDEWAEEAEDFDYYDDLLAAPSISLFVD